MNERSKKQRTEDLTFHLGCITDDLLSQHPQLDYILYVSEAWLKRRVAGHATFYVNDEVVMEQVESDLLDEIVRQWQQPLKCKGQRQFKLVA